MNSENTKPNYKFVVEGLAGKRLLKGKVSINGAKNAVLKAIAAAVLFKDGLLIQNVPQTNDVATLVLLMVKMGISVQKKGSSLYIFAPNKLITTELDFDTAVSMRASIVLTGPILARYGAVTFPAPGGCVLGNRPIDLFVEGYRKMGANVEINSSNDRYTVSVPKNLGGRLSGTDIFFPVQTVGGTETLMMAAILSAGVTILKNCAIEPEITSLADFLVSCGAKISGIGTTTLTIRGGKLLSSNGKKYKTIPDRIEAGSFLLLGALLSDNLTVDKCNPSHLESVLNVLNQVGVKTKIGKDYVKILGMNDKQGNFSELPPNFNIRTHEYPGFPTDLQAQVVAFLTQIPGESVIFETIYDGRFKYVEDLKKLGADISILNSREVKVRGSKKLTAQPMGQELMAHDIRAGFAVLMAALFASGESVISNVRLIDRGYEAVEVKLGKIGANIKRI